MTPFVLLGVADRPPVALGPGDLIGRNPRAALTLDDASVSEAHAMVSLREGALVLLGLRGLFTVDGRGSARQHVELRVGMTLQLSRGVELTVHDLHLPQRVLTIASAGAQPQLVASVGSLVRAETGAVVYETRYRNRALAHLWSYGDSWQLQIGDESPRDVDEGSRFEVGGESFELGGTELQTAMQHATNVADSIHPPLRLRAMFDVVTIERAGYAPVTLSRTAARILSELVQFGEPVHWELIAREIWPQESDSMVLRGRWDVSLRRLRQRLKAQGLRDDLVTNQNGTIHLALRAGDVAVDEA